MVPGERVQGLRVLGVDPGLTITGYAVVEWSAERPVLLEAGTIRPVRGASLAVRLVAIADDLADVLGEFHPTVMGLESLYSAYRHPRSALQMAHARGVVCLAAAQAGIEVMDIAPAAVKSAVVGARRATKEQVQRTIQTLYALDELPSPSDVADAIAIATAVAYRVLRGPMGEAE